MLLIGATPQNRNIEQHDIFFGIGEELKDLVPGIKSFWPEAKSKLHIDAWREVTYVDGFAIQIERATSHPPNSQLQIPNSQLQIPNPRLFFLNLGGYIKNEFEEFHYKMIVVAAEKGEAIARAKQTAFYKHTGFKGATSHIDDKYGVDVDDVFEINDILSSEMKSMYKIIINRSEGLTEDESHLGYFKLDKVAEGIY